MDNIFNLGADELVNQQIEAGVNSLFGPTSAGHALLVDGRAIPNITVRDEGDHISFVLDGRMEFTFPRQVARMAASFAANSMAVGAGYSWLGADSKSQPFAPEAIGITTDYLGPEKTSGR